MPHIGQTENALRVLKEVLPFEGGEVDAGVGSEVYFANIKAKGTTSSGDFSNDAHVVGDMG